MILGVFGALALATPAAAHGGVTISAGVDVFLPMPGTTVVFSTHAMPEAVVVDTGVYGTVVLEQRLRHGRVNTVRMNLRYPHRHRVRGHVVNDYVWVRGERMLASKVFRHYHVQPTRYRAYRHAHAHAVGYKVHGGHRGHHVASHRHSYRDDHRHGNYGRHPGHTHSKSERRNNGRKDRDRRDYRADRDTCHEAGHPGRGHAYGKCKKSERDYAKAEREREMEKERRKANKESDKAEKERRKEEKKQAKAEEKRDKKNDKKSDARRGKGKGKRNDKSSNKNNSRNRKRV
jgi:hypothetical protein